MTCHSQLISFNLVWFFFNPPHCASARASVQDVVPVEDRRARPQGEGSGDEAVERGAGHQHAPGARGQTLPRLQEERRGVSGMTLTLAGGRLHKLKLQSDGKKGEEQCSSLLLLFEATVTVCICLSLRRMLVPGHCLSTPCCHLVVTLRIAVKCTVQGGFLLVYFHNEGF